jgi:hypothetical protein
MGCKPTNKLCKVVKPCQTSQGGFKVNYGHIRFRNGHTSTQITKMGDNHVAKWIIDLCKLLQVQINTKIARIDYNQIAKWII